MLEGFNHKTLQDSFNIFGMETSSKIFPKEKRSIHSPFEGSQILSSLGQFHILPQKKVMALLATPQPCQLNK